MFFKHRHNFYSYFQLILFQKAFHLHDNLELKYL